MNMMSSLGWALYRKRHRAATQYIEFFSEMAAAASQQTMASHSVIFYSSIKQLIQLGTMNLGDFLDKDVDMLGYGNELFNQTLHFKFLPCLEASDQEFTNEYKRNINVLERNLKQALMIDEISSPENAFSKKELNLPAGPLYEVQYGLIDLNWVNILNIFDQVPINRLWQQQLAAKKCKRSSSVPFDYNTEIKKYSDNFRPLLWCLSCMNDIDIFNHHSTRLIIDHYWKQQGYHFFKIQFYAYVIFFVFPFGVDLYYLMYFVFGNNEIPVAQNIF